MREAVALCPASLSFIFKVCPNKDLVKMGSIGIGCTLDKGVIVKVQINSSSKIFFNGSPIQFPTVLSVVKKLALKPVSVKIKADFPLGCGFGLSSAAALACALALDKLFNLGKSRLELTKIAHVAEIVNRTGLGSVGTQISGGFLFKTSAGLPLQAKKFSFIGQRLYAILIDRLETPGVLKNKNLIKIINKAADRAFFQIRKNKISALSEFIDISYRFTQESLLLNNQKVQELIEKIRREGGHATMAMLGQVVISDRKPMIKDNYRIEELRISGKTVNLG